MKYLTISPNSVHTIFSNAKLTEIRNEKNYHLIASTYFVDESLLIPYETLASNICILGFDKFKIYYIFDLKQEDISERCKDHKHKHNTLVFEIIFISLDNLVSLLNSADFNFAHTNKHCMYIFNDMR